ncbi:MAG: hypothetical protein AB1861_23805 [Cyanobacteriota bacterium]
MYKSVDKSGQASLNLLGVNGFAGISDRLRRCQRQSLEVTIDKSLFALL